MVSRPGGAENPHERAAGPGWPEGWKRPCAFLATADVRVCIHSARLNPKP